MVRGVREERRMEFVELESSDLHDGHVGLEVGIG